MIDKLVLSFFSPLTKVEFEYRGTTYKPRRLTISPQIFRTFDCPAGCGACCIQGSLEWLPHEKVELYGGERLVSVPFNGMNFPLVVDDQRGDRRLDQKCRHLDRQTGRCSIHTMVGKVHPMLCDTVPLRSSVYTDDRRGARLSHELPGRLWALRRIDGGKGGQCSLDPVWSDDERESLLRRLDRLREWCLYFRVDTWIDDIIQYVQTGPHDWSLVRNDS